MNAHRSATTLARMGLAMMTLVAIMGLVPTPLDQARPAAAETPLVPDTPSTGYPVIQRNGSYQVRAANQVGDYILSGGDFQQVKLQNGTTINQPYFTAWHIDTKQIICTNLTFDDEVLDIIPGNTANTAFVSGRFRNVVAPNGTFKRSKIVKIDLPSCNVVAAFDVQGTWGKISELALSGNRLFVGGDFSQINGQSVGYLAELNANTGTVNTNFNLNVVKGLSTVFRGMGVNPAGTRLVVGGRWSSISGVSTGPTAVINISGASPVLTAHRSSGMVGTQDMQDAAVSPDGTKIALVYGTATVSDYVYVIQAAEQSVTYTWRHYMRDSSFGVGLTNDIVYVGGHFCKIDSGPGATSTMSPNTLEVCSGVFFPGGAWRSQLAALDISNGTPLTWNPGNNSFTGARELTVTSRGLLVGYDGDRTNSILVGPLAFFDLGGGGGGGGGGGATCTATVTAGTVVMTWSAVDGNPSYQVRKNNAWQAQTNNTTFTLTGSMNDTFAVRYWTAGGNTDINCDNVDGGGGGGGATCTKTAGGGGVQLSWNQVGNIGTYYVRLNNSWIATVNGTSYTHQGGNLGAAYAIRYWSNGAKTDITCN